MKKIIFYTVAMGAMLAAPLAANASGTTLHCNVGDFRIADASSGGFTRASFRRETYSSDPVLCDRKSNVYCAVDRSDPNVVRLKRTVRLGHTADGEILMAFEYAVDTRANTVTTHISDRYGSVFSEDPVSACSVGPDDSAVRQQLAMRTPAWPLRVMGD